MQSYRTIATGLGQLYTAREMQPPNIFEQLKTLEDLVIPAGNKLISKRKQKEPYFIKTLVKACVKL